MSCFGFLTTEANAIVAPIHPKAMPVILRTREQFDLWLEGDLLDPCLTTRCGSWPQARRRTALSLN